MYQYMYDYYNDQEVLPTYGRFQSQSDLDAHEQARRNLFTDKLCLPPRLFKDARLIEFGPDAGENSLVFARWEASCTLVEPNPKAHPVIRDYFDRFRLGRRLAGISESDVKKFAEQETLPERFDFVDAEGFIYTVKPDSLWVDLFTRLVDEEGFVILFYCEAVGSFMELLLKVIHNQVRRLTQTTSLQAARELFRAKWNSIPHKRSMESWVMDVLENPFVRLQYFLEPQTLCRQMASSGLSLYSSWPSYKDSAAVHWFKKELTVEEQLRAQDEFISRSRLSHLFGRIHLLLHSKPAVDKTLANLLTVTDGLIDDFDSERVLQCIEGLEVVGGLLRSKATFGETKGVAQSLQAIRSVEQILHLLLRGKVEVLKEFCNKDEGFITTWGTPSHFAVFRKGRSESASDAGKTGK
jgi:hypothetical protein